MAWMLLIVEPVGQRRTRTEDEGRELYTRMLDFSAELQARGASNRATGLATEDGVASKCLRVATVHRRREEPLRFRQHSWCDAAGR